MMGTLYNSDTSNLTEDHGFYSTVVFVFFILSLVIAVENILVIISLVFFRSKSYSINPLICSLSLTAILHLLGPVAIAFHVYVSRDSLGFQRYSSLCELQGWLITFLRLVSTLSILLLAVDRTLSLTKQTFYRRKWKGSLLLSNIFACWILSAFVASWSLYGLTVKPSIFCPHIYCLFTPDSDFAVVYASLQLIVVMFCGLCVYYTTRSSRHTLFSARYSSSTGKMAVEKTRNLVQEQYDRKMTRMVNIVIAVYCVSLLPWVVAIFLGYFSVNYPQIYGLLSLQIPMVSGLCNPFLYGLLWPPFRRAYLEVLRAPLRRWMESSSSSRSHDLQGSSLSRSQYSVWTMDGFNPKNADQQLHTLEALFGPSSHSAKPIDLMPEELRMFENDGLSTDGMSVVDISYDTNNVKGNELPAAAINIDLENSAQFQSILDLIDEMTEGKAKGCVLSDQQSLWNQSMNSKDWSAEKSSAHALSEEETEVFGLPVNKGKTGIRSRKQKRSKPERPGTPGCLGKSKCYVLDDNKHHYLDYLVAKEPQAVAETSDAVVFDM